jgi:cell division protein FtsN
MRKKTIVAVAAAALLAFAIAAYAVAAQQAETIPTYTGA